MAVAKMDDDKAPRVEELSGNVAIWAEGEDGEQSGLVLSAPSASTSAIRMLAVVARLRGDDLPAFPTGSVAVDHRLLDDGEDVVRLTFDIEGVPIAVYVGLTQFAELTAAFVAASRDIDRVGRPRRDG